MNVYHIGPQRRCHVLTPETIAFAEVEAGLDQGDTFGMTTTRGNNAPSVQ